MANEGHIRRIREGAAVWNDWIKDRTFHVDLAYADFRGADLRKINLRSAVLYGSKMAGANLEGALLFDASLKDTDLRSAVLKNAMIQGADLIGANLGNANLTGAFLKGTIFVDTDLSGADLSRADLTAAHMANTDLSGANLTEARLYETVFSNVNLTGAVGLGECSHGAASSVDYRTLQKSGSLPLKFLRGVGLPDAIIDYLPSLLNQPIQLYSCFISYSTRDQGFADRLHADLQDGGIRCWFAPHDMPIGGKIWDEIDAAIRLRDKVLLILSEHSIKSDWVEDEVTKAFEEERRRGQTVLFPIRLDDAVMDTDEAWAGKLRARHIGDFTRWKEHDEYSKSFARVLRDLTVKTGAS
jgi:hypothetical protein